MQLGFVRLRVFYFGDVMISKVIYKFDPKKDYNVSKFLKNKFDISSDWDSIHRINFKDKNAEKQIRDILRKFKSEWETGKGKSENYSEIVFPLYKKYVINFERFLFDFLNMFWEECRSRIKLNVPAKEKRLRFYAAIYNQFSVNLMSDYLLLTFASNVDDNQQAEVIKYLKFTEDHEAYFIYQLAPVFKGYFSLFNLSYEKFKIFTNGGRSTDERNNDSDLFYKEMIVFSLVLNDKPEIIKMSGLNKDALLVELVKGNYELLIEKKLDGREQLNRKKNPDKIIKAFRMWKSRNPEKENEIQSLLNASELLLHADLIKKSFDYKNFIGNLPT